MEKLLGWLKIPSHVSRLFNGLNVTEGMLLPIGGGRERICVVPIRLRTPLNGALLKEKLYPLAPILEKNTCNYRQVMTVTGLMVPQIFVYPKGLLFSKILSIYFLRF